MIDKDMKKQYIEPTIAIFNITITNIVAESVVISNEYAKEDYIVGYGNTDAREDNNIFREDHNVWDNLW